MRCLRSGRRFLLRLERGEEVIASLKAFARREAVPGASLAGLGAADDVTVAFYDLEEKAYRSYRHRGLIEIVSLAGNLSWAGDSPLVHLHVMAVHEKEGPFGGHLDAARVTATVEIAVDPYEERVSRAPDAEIGLPLLDLPVFRDR